MKCVICSTGLTGLQRRFCSRKCQAKHGNTKHQCYAAQQARGETRKLLLIERMGGGCTVCGYKKNRAALVFHHLRDKKFNLDLRSLSNRKWERIEAEVAKCQLLCHNCHTEIHNPRCSL